MRLGWQFRFLLLSPSHFTFNARATNQLGSICYSRISGRLRDPRRCPSSVAAAAAAAVANAVGAAVGNITRSITCYIHLYRVGHLVGQKGQVDYAYDVPPYCPAAQPFLLILQ